MVGYLKHILFFPVAYYFAFFAKIQLRKWNPRIVVVTGSSGKTTLLHMIESQVGEKAHYSHHANSAIGIPFDILDLHRKTFKPLEWIGLFLKAPQQAFREPFKKTIYIAECDADRPGEGTFLSKLLRPEVTAWVSTSRTHSMNFDKLVPNKFASVDNAIAFEFGSFLQHTTRLGIIQGDSPLMIQQLSRTSAEIEKIYLKDLDEYEVLKTGTKFITPEGTSVFKYLLPQEIYYSIEMARKVCNYLVLPFDSSFKNLHLPPARSSVFRGIKNIIIIDSTYNANLSSMTAILSMFQKLQAKTKWLVIGDMLEQGKEEQKEHEELAQLVLKTRAHRIVFLGPRVKKYTYPIVSKKLQKTIPVIVFENPKDVLDHLTKHIQGGETILFKGARFLEGVIENLLLDKKEKSLLARREKVWEERRKKWGL